MKLILIAHISKLRWQVIDEFFEQDPRFKFYGNYIKIKNDTTSSMVCVLRNDNEDFRFHLYQVPTGLLTVELYEMLTELADQVRAGDFSKLLELADTWFYFDELLKKEN